MLRNYLTIAFRNMHRNLGYTAINVSGLAVGMAACLLIGLYVGDELSFSLNYGALVAAMTSEYVKKRPIRQGVGGEAFLGKLEG